VFFWEACFHGSLFQLVGLESLQQGNEEQGWILNKKKRMHLIQNIQSAQSQ
jgi:hypothetical protein